MTHKHRQGNVREAALTILIKIDKNQAYSNLLINDTITKMKVPEIDTPLLTELVYGTLQHQKRMDFYISAFSKKKPEKLDRWVLILLRMSVYQLVCLERVPDHAVINEAVEIAKKRGHKGISGMVNGVLRAMLRKGLPSVEEIGDDLHRLSVETSHPEWLITRWIKQYGFSQAEKMAHANLSAPVHAVRVNTCRTDKSFVRRQLEEAGLNTYDSPLLQESIRFEKGSVVQTAAYKDGLLTIQDEGSMLVTELLDPQPGEKILDACAAPGGKSTHIAERMKNNGELISVDIHAHKVKLIEQQQQRLKLHVIKGMTADARSLHETFEQEQFDKILVDAPCSGLGVIQRKPDLKWAKSGQDSAQLAVIQSDILDSVWPLLKKGGRLIYSTCTVDVEENDNVINHFKAKHNDAECDETMWERLPSAIRDKKNETPGKIQLFPGEFGTDGFFISSVMKQVREEPAHI